MTISISFYLLNASGMLIKNLSRVDHSYLCFVCEMHSTTIVNWGNARVFSKKKRCSFANTKEEKTKTHLQIHDCIDLLFQKKLDRQLPTVTYAAIIRTIRAFDGFWLKRGKRIAMMVRAFQSVLCVNKPIYVVCYKELCDVGQFYLLLNSLRLLVYMQFAVRK